MDFKLRSDSVEKQRTSCIIVGVFASRQLSAAAKKINTVSKQHLANLMRHRDIGAEKGECLLLYDVPGIAASRLLLVGCGKAKDFDADAYQGVIASSIAALKTQGIASVVSYLTALPVAKKSYTWKLKQAVQITQHTLYQFDELKSKPSQKKPLTTVTFAVPAAKISPAYRSTLKEARALANGVQVTRDLGNRPSNICTPTYLAEQAVKLATKHRNLTSKILTEAEMKKLGMHSLLAVTAGSTRPAKLITLQYKGAASTVKPIVLVGKGVTFDTGGISLKPAPAMDEMKYDMCGAAAVLGTLTAVAEMGLTANVVGVIPAVENMPGGAATNPGDIVKSASGLTIEILNTDAEGRLILCDAMTYSARFNPSVVIDIATLTGACVVALGKHATGLFSNHDKLAQDLLSAGEESGDRAWRLPLWKEYRQQLKSPFADIANIGGRDAGAITAGCFLSHFAEKYHWAHLDIAGTAWLSGAKKGATGRPVPLLTQYIIKKTQR